MPEQINLQTDMTTIQENGVLTALVKYEGNNVNLTTDPAAFTLTLLPNILPACQNDNNIKQTVGQQDGVSYKEGELILAIRGNDNVNFDIDENGYVTINAEDALRYIVDNDGHLIYDYLVPTKDFPY